MQTECLAFHLYTLPTMPRVSVTRGGKSSVKTNITVASGSQEAIPRTGGMHSRTRVTTEKLSNKGLQEANKAAEHKRRKLLSGP